MKITGELLKAERIKQSLTVQDVAYSLKLSNKIVQAIESGTFEELPAKTFVRGFVKSYADYLKMDSVVVMKQFQEEMGSTNPMPRVPPPSSAQEVKKQKSPSSLAMKADYEAQALNQTLSPRGFNQKNIIIIVSVSLLVLAIGVVNSLVTKYQKESVPNEEVKNISGALNTQTVVGSTNPEQIINTSVPSGAPADAATSVGTEKEAPSDVTTEPATKKFEYPALTASAGKPVELLIEAKKDVIIDYAKGNSSSFIRMQLKQNTYQILRSTTGLHIRAEDGSALHLTVNGIIKGAASAAAKPIQLTY